MLEQRVGLKCDRDLRLRVPESNRCFGCSLGERIVEVLAPQRAHRAEIGRVGTGSAA